MILVTGGAGFIGSALVKALVAAGEKVRVLDNASRRGLEKSKTPRGVEFVWQDVRYEDAVENAADGVDEIIHLAFINGTERFYKEPGLVLDVAVRGIWSVLEAAFALKIKRLTLFSSSEVCRAKLVDTEEAIPLVIPDPYNPRYSYSAGKIISEMMAIHNADQFDRLLIARPFNIYGPGMSAGHVVPDFIEQFAKMDYGKRNRFTMLGSGSETRSFCYIDDLIDGVMLMREKGEHMGIYNIGNPVETTIAQLAFAMANILGLEIEVHHSEHLREGDAPRRKPDITKLAALGYKPKVDLVEGLRRTMQHAVPSLRKSVADPGVVAGLHAAGKPDAVHRGR